MDPRRIAQLRLFAARSFLGVMTVMALACGVEASGAADVGATVQRGLVQLAGARLDLHGTLAAAPARVVMPKGRDVDGDGAPDFVSPTGFGLRFEDNFGSGAFLASRDGGVRRHLGADFDAAPGQAVAAPISGYVTKIGFAYAGDQQLRYVELTNRAIGYMARVFYIDPRVEIGQAVRLGQAVGVALTLQARYPGITDHVHVELTDLARGHVDPAKFIPSPGAMF
jgi:murein DD-endopeptidase MepM/ murein hydrolase activator NlpD